MEPNQIPVPGDPNVSAAEMPPAAREKQLRLALVLSGGVSLAVWMAGVTYEIDLLRRADSDHGRSGDMAKEWKRLLAHSPYSDAVGVLGRRGDDQRQQLPLTAVAVYIAVRRPVSGICSARPLRAGLGLRQPAPG